MGAARVLEHLVVQATHRVSPAPLVRLAFSRVVNRSDAAARSVRIVIAPAILGMIADGATQADLAREMHSDEKDVRGWLAGKRITAARLDAMGAIAVEIRRRLADGGSR